MNPPYAAAGTLKSVSDTGKSKTGVAKTAVNEEMNKDKIGKCSQNLYAQFLYRCVEIGRLFNIDVTIACFTPPLYMSGGSFKGLRKYFNENDLSVVDSFLFKASDFSDVAGNWGISFSILKCNKTSDFLVADTYIKELEAFNVVSVARKRIYNLDSELSGSDWKKPIEALEKIPYVTLKSAVNIDYDNKYDVKSCEGSLGYYYDKSNIVEKNGIQVFLLSAPSSDAHGTYILGENFNRIISNFTARKLITGTHATWVNSKDEYRVPLACRGGCNLTQEEKDLYTQWEKDCLVYSCFDNASYQSSLRNLVVKGITYKEVPNNFFFMTVGEFDTLLKTTKVADDSLDAVSSDFNTYGKARYMAEQLELHMSELSPDAKAVLDLAKVLVGKTLKCRDEFYGVEPRYQTNTWDAGWYQIKAMLKEYYPDDLKEFNTLFKAFSDRMRPLVYELGFLEELKVD